MGESEFTFARIAPARVGDELMVRRLGVRMVVFAFWWCPDILAVLRLPAEIRFENRVYFRSGGCLKSSRFLQASIDRVGPEGREADVLSFGDCEIDANDFVDYQKFTIVGLPAPHVAAKVSVGEAELLGLRQRPDHAAARRAHGPDLHPSAIASALPVGENWLAWQQWPHAAP